MNAVRLNDFQIGGTGNPLAIIAGPCVIEVLDLCREIAAEAKAICAALGLPYIFKASFDKANRTSGGSFRGQRIGERAGSPGGDQIRVRRSCADGHP